MYQAFYLPMQTVYQKPPGLDALVHGCRWCLSKQNCNRGRKETESQVQFSGFEWRPTKPQTVSSKKRFVVTYKAKQTIIKMTAIRVKREPILGKG